MDKPITFQKIESDVSSVMERKWFVQYLYVAKCNLGKVNLEAMLVSSFPSHAEGGPMLLAGASCDLHTRLLAYSSLQSVAGIALLLAFHFCAVFLFFSSSNNVCSPDQQLSICQFFRRKFATRCDSERRAFCAHFALHRGELFAPILVHCFRAGCWQSGVPNPALVAVVDAVKAALAAEKGAGPSSNNVSSASLGNSTTVALPSTSGGVPAHSPSLSQQTATFLTSGGAFPEQQPTPSAPSATHCRSNFSVPSFVATFATLRSPILSTMITPSASVPVPSSDRSLAANLLSGPATSTAVRKRSAELSLASMWIWVICYLSTSFRLSLSPKHSLTDALRFCSAEKKLRCRIEDILTWSRSVYDFYFDSDVPFFRTDGDI